MIPIIKNKVFFFNLIILMIVPSMINAYWINVEQYVTISSIYKYGIKIRDGASIPYIFFVPFVISYILSFIMIGVGVVSKKLERCYKLFIYFTFLVLLVVNLFLLLNFSTMISPSIVMLVAETGQGETFEFFQTYLLCGKSLMSYAISLAMLIYLLVSEYVFSSQIENRYSISIICIVCIYMFVRSISPIQIYFRLFDCKNLSDAELWYLEYPVNTNSVSNFVYSTFVMLLSRQEMDLAIQNTISVKDEITTSDNVNLILVIGESFSKHHSSLYDYDLTTNPQLQKMKDDGNLFVFNDVISSFNLTSFVIRNLFSVNSIMDHETWAYYPAFPILFKKAGYCVFFWDNQRTFGKADVSDFSISSYLFNDSICKCSYTNYNHKVFEYDGELVEDFYRNVNIEGEKNLVIFHLMGQHTMPDKRYPKNLGFDVFTRDSIKREDLDDRKRAQIAYYDNATVYNDWIITQIINPFIDKNAIMVYFSDHGEEIYDFRDHYGRTQEKEKTAELLRCQYEIPFMIWCSDLYIKKHQEEVSIIKSSVDKPFMNDNVCQILMGIVGMKTPYYHPERNLISSDFKPYSHRNVQNSVNYEEIMYRYE